MHYLSHLARSRLLLAATLACSVLAAHAQTPTHKHYQHSETFDTPSPTGAVAPRLQNVGKHAFNVTTKSEQAQRFMNQGLNLTYGFNHAEAGRAFAEAARLDPDLAMAHWGQALVLGPNINAAMPPEEEPKALEHLRKAQALKAKASQRERDYIDALAMRYTGKADDRAAADQAFAGAMRVLHEKYPDDQDAATLYAESLMDLSPWNYWTRDGRPYERTHDIIASLDKVLKANPEHPGALHLWIHLWEASNTPEKAEAAADRLLPLAPAAGHLVHMPGHIYQRVGRYTDAVKANQLAIVADEDYITQCRAQGLYPLAYYPHNVHFLWFGATMAGQSQLAIDAAKKTANSIPEQALKDLPMLQAFVLTPDYALVRFGKWDEILSAPAPRADTHVYARRASLRARHGVHPQEGLHGGAEGDRGGAQDRQRSQADRNALLVVAQPGGRRAARRGRSARRRVRRGERRLRQGDRSSRPRGALSGRAHLHGTRRLASARPPQSGRCACCRRGVR